MKNRREGTVAARRLQHRPGDAFQVEVDGEAVEAYPGESLAAVLMVSGWRSFMAPDRYHLARTLFCGMGLCHQCLVNVDGKRSVRACMTPARPGMKITTIPAEGDEAI